MNRAGRWFNGKQVKKKPGHCQGTVRPTTIRQEEGKDTVSQERIQVRLLDKVQAIFVLV